MIVFKAGTMGVVAVTGMCINYLGIRAQSKPLACYMSYYNMHIGRIDRREREETARLLHTIQ